MKRHGEGGSVSLLVLGLAALAIVLSLLTADLAVFLAARAQAQVAADAAALAAAPLTFVGGDAHGAAAATAVANGARLTRCDCRNDSSWQRRSVMAAVAVSANLTILPSATVTAQARAVFDPVRLRG